MKDNTILLRFGKCSVYIKYIHFVISGLTKYVTLHLQTVGGKKTGVLPLPCRGEGSLSILQSMRSLKLVPRHLRKSPPPWFSYISSIFVFAEPLIGAMHSAYSQNKVSFYLDKSRYYSLRSKSTGRIGYTSFKRP